LFRVTQPARRFLLQEGTDLKYGARHLKRAIEKFVVYPLANLLATEQIRSATCSCIDWDGKSESLVFEKEGEGAVLPAWLQRQPRRIPLRGCDWRKAGRAPSRTVIVREAKLRRRCRPERVLPVASGSPQKTTR
jgi:hypothetical protein